MLVLWDLADKTSIQQRTKLSYFDAFQMLLDSYTQMKDTDEIFDGVIYQRPIKIADVRYKDSNCC